MMNMLARGIIGQLKYNAYRRKNTSDACVFCYDDGFDKSREILKETDTTYVIKNDFPYKRWSGQMVKNHLLIIPKMHTLHLPELSLQEREDMMNLIAEYDTEGYSFYIRSSSDKYRSVGHIHGHLFSYE